MQNRLLGAARALSVLPSELLCLLPSVRAGSIPSCPKPLWPQELTIPDELRVRVCCWPAATRALECLLLRITSLGWVTLLPSLPWPASNYHSWQLPCSVCVMEGDAPAYCVQFLIISQHLEGHGHNRLPWRTWNSERQPAHLQAAGLGMQGLCFLPCQNPFQLRCIPNWPNSFAPHDASIPSATTDTAWVWPTAAWCTLKASREATLDGAVSDSTPSSSSAYCCMPLGNLDDSQPSWLFSLLPHVSKSPSPVFSTRG